MQGIYSYIPETNHVSRVHSVAAILYLQSVLHVMLFRPWNMFGTFILALPAVCVQCPIWLFLQFLNFVCCSSIVWVILKWFHLRQLLLVYYYYYYYHHHHYHYHYHNHHHDHHHHHHKIEEDGENGVLERVYEIRNSSRNLYTIH
jgi:O-antigen ligase